ncbi:MAG: hypothetical protein V7K89_32350 [Nostoc sp.]|uniref:hypothetical protein n=1 Tax=Nostoc sp. TaxID=1180 RepID=UPI002FF9E71A
MPPLLPKVNIVDIAKAIYSSVSTIDKLLVLWKIKITKMEAGAIAAKILKKNLN